MTITNNVVAKASVALVALAMAVSLVAPKAHAADVSTMSLDELIALVTQLQAQVGQNTAAVGSCDSIPAPLTIGSQGASVTALQNALIAAGQSIPAGATGYFGSQTQAALAAWQAANGVSPAVGYYGPITKAAMDAKCVPATPGDDDMDDDDDDSDSDSDVELSGEASLKDVTMNDGDDTDLEEGQEDAPVAEMEVEFSDGDAMISRIDVSLVSAGGGTDDEQDPWDTFETVSLWVDGDMVAEMAADDEDDYLDEDDGSLRFSGLDIVAMEDEETTIVIAVTVQGSVDGTDDDEDWTVGVDAIRYVDADDVTTTDDSTGDLMDGDDVDIDFTISEEGADDELLIKTSTEDPDATTLKVDTSSKSDWFTIFAFDLDTDDSVNDIEVNNISIGLQTDDNNITDVVSDVMLVIDGEEYDDFDWVDSTGAEGSLDFDIDGDLVIDAGDRVTVEVQVEFKTRTDYAEGTTITASTTEDAYDAEGADDVDAEGSAVGEDHTLRTSGGILEFVSATETQKDNSDSTTTDDSGTFVLKFDVTAFEADLYVNKSAASGTVATTVGVNYQVTDGSGTVVDVGTPTQSLSSSADTVSGQYVVRDGETETFTLTVSIDPDTTGFYGARVYSFNFKPDATGNPTVWQRALPASDYESDPLEING